MNAKNTGAASNGLTAKALREIDHASAHIQVQGDR
jgi:hypothetical protein